MSDGQDLSATGLLAIDVGSSRVKLGWFPPLGECTAEDELATLPIAIPRLPQPAEKLAVSHVDSSRLFSEIGSWLQAACPASPPAYVASVHPQALAILQEMFTQRLQPITAEQLAIDVQLEHPEQVGIDRLLNALAINQVRAADNPAIVVDLGTACTVDRISSDGAFEGGAILPGAQLAAEALHTGTASLPRLTFENKSAAEVIGKTTQSAMHAGLFWGAVGAVRELVTRMSQAGQSSPQVFVTGGDAPLLVEYLQSETLTVRHLPNLVLSGIALVAEDLS